MIPIALFGVVPAYNIPELFGLPPLVFSLQTLAEIYLGHIIYWNDSAIAATNPLLQDVLPNQPIIIGYQPGSSPNTDRLSKLLSINSEFNSTVRISLIVK